MARALGERLVQRRDPSSRRTLPRCFPRFVRLREGDPSSAPRSRASLVSTLWRETACERLGLRDRWRGAAGRSWRTHAADGGHRQRHRRLLRGRRRSPSGAGRESSSAVPHFPTSISLMCSRSRGARRRIDRRLPSRAGSARPVSCRIAASARPIGALGSERATALGPGLLDRRARRAVVPSRCLTAGHVAAQYRHLEVVPDGLRGCYRSVFAVLHFGWSVPIGLGSRASQPADSEPDFDPQVPRGRELFTCAIPW
jgi:hypothetical protein